MSWVKSHIYAAGKIGNAENKGLTRRVTRTHYQSPRHSPRQTLHQSKILDRQESDGESESETGDYDLDICPPGCDQLEKQQKLNKLDIVATHCMHQIQYIINSVLPSDLSQTLVFESTGVVRLQQRTKELEHEKFLQKKQMSYDRSDKRSRHLSRGANLSQVFQRSSEEACPAHQRPAPF